MGPGTILVGGIVFFAVVLISKSIRVVQQAQTLIIERLGKYHNRLASGINLVGPVSDRPRAVDWHQTIITPAGDSYSRRFRTERIDLRETVYVFPRQNVITTDNVIGEMELDHILSWRDTINAKLRAILDEATHKWGSKVSRVEIKDINPPRDIRDAMEKQMRAERERRATIITADAERQSRILAAEGIRQSEINTAEGDKAAKILHAEAEAAARLKVAEAEAQAIERITAAIKGTGGDPARYLIAIRYIETLKEMVSGQNNKVVYMPYEATGVLGSLGGIREMLALGPSDKKA